MPLNKIEMRPSRESYTLTMSSGVVAQQVDGGPPRSRVDVLNPWSPMTVQWTNCTQDEYEYLQQAFRFTEVNGGAHFLLDLFMSHSVLDEHECMFQPGTFALVDQNGLTFTVKADIWVAPSLGDDNTWPVVGDFPSIITDDDGEPITT